MSVVTLAIIVSMQTVTATFEGNLEDQAELMNKMAPNVDAVVIITNQIGNMSDVSSMKIYAISVGPAFRSTAFKTLLRIF